MRQKQIFCSGKYGQQAFGDLTDIKVGDAVRYILDNKSVVGQVEKVNVRAKVLRVARQMYGEKSMRPPKTLSFDVVLEVFRTVSEEEAAEMQKKDLEDAKNTHTQMLQQATTSTKVNAGRLGKRPKSRRRLVRS